MTELSNRRHALKYLPEDEKKLISGKLELKIAL